jgi:hypothetical protein
LGLSKVQLFFIPPDNGDPAFCGANPARFIFTTANPISFPELGHVIFFTCDRDPVARVIETLQRLRPFAPRVIPWEQSKEPLVSLRDCLRRVPNLWRGFSLPPVAFDGMVAHVTAPPFEPANELRARAPVGLVFTAARALPVFIFGLRCLLKLAQSFFRAELLEISSNVHRSLRRPGRE